MLSLSAPWRRESSPTRPLTSGDLMHHSIAEKLLDGKRLFLFIATEILAHARASSPHVIPAEFRGHGFLGSVSPEFQV